MIVTKLQYLLAVATLVKKEKAGKRGDSAQAPPSVFYPIKKCAQWFEL
jgi:hypothetical protein